MTQGTQDLEETHELILQFEKQGGVVPVVVQEREGGTVLMVAYVNRTALERTRSSGYATFYSRSRDKLWVKGDFSGHYLMVREIRVDCDQDALLYLVDLVSGGACHTRNASGHPRRSCFYRKISEEGGMEHLEE